MREEFPYHGYVDVEIEGVPPFVMFSNNDDRIAQTYFWYGPNAYETLSLRLWASLTTHATSVFDVGAFSGVYALVAARVNRAATVHAFEAIGRVFDRLVINKVVNRLGPRVGLWQLALGDADGAATMNIFQAAPTRMVTGSSLTTKGRAPAATEHVTIARLDSFIATHDVARVDLVKIDVEGAEALVLGGMAATIARDRPTLLVEVAHREGLEPLLDSLGTAYHFAVIDDAAQRVWVDDADRVGGFRNVLFMAAPRARVEEVCALPPL